MTPEEVIRIVEELWLIWEKQGFAALSLLTDPKPFTEAFKTLVEGEVTRPIPRYVLRHAATLWRFWASKTQAPYVIGRELTRFRLPPDTMDEFAKNYAVGATYLVAGIVAWYTYKFLRDLLTSTPEIYDNPTAFAMCSQDFTDPSTYELQIGETHAGIQAGVGAGPDGDVGFRCKLPTPNEYNPAWAKLLLHTKTPKFNHITVVFLYTFGRSQNKADFVAQLSQYHLPYPQLSGYVSDLVTARGTHQLISDNFAHTLQRRAVISYGDPPWTIAAWDYDLLSENYGSVVAAGALYDIPTTPVYHVPLRVAFHNQLEIYFRTYGGPDEEFALSHVLVWNSGTPVTYHESVFGYLPISEDDTGQRTRGR